jgi:hypothetical protein
MVKPSQNDWPLAGLPPANEHQSYGDPGYRQQTGLLRGVYALWVLAMTKQTDFDAQSNCQTIPKLRPRTSIPGLGSVMPRLEWCVKYPATVKACFLSN